MSESTIFLGRSWALSLVLSSCGGPSRPTPVPAEKPSAEVELQLQDQRFELEPMRVALAALLGERSEVHRGRGVSPRPLHTSDNMNKRAQEGTRDVRECVDAAALGPALIPAGEELSLQLEIDSAGQVLGGSTTPRPGEQGVALAADCLLERARQWHFPVRTTPGSTVLIVRYQID